MRGEVGDRRHHLGHAGLVVGAEQRVAARGDDVVADRVAQLGHPLGVEHRAAPRQRDHAAVVVAVHERLDAGAGLVRARVQVREQADHRRALHGRGQRRGHEALRVLLGVGEPDPRSSSTSRRPSSSCPGVLGRLAGTRGRTACRCGRSAAGGRARRRRAPRRAGRVRRRSCGASYDPACLRLDDRLRAAAARAAGRRAARRGRRAGDRRPLPAAVAPARHVARRGSASCSARTGSPTSTARRSARRPTCATTSTRGKQARGLPRPRRGDGARGARRARRRLEHGPRTALLCLEADPAGCHRRVLAERCSRAAARLRVVDL